MFRDYVHVVPCHLTHGLPYHMFPGRTSLISHKAARSPCSDYVSDMLEHGGCYLSLGIEGMGKYSTGSAGALNVPLTETRATVLTGTRRYSVYVSSIFIVSVLLP